MSIALARRYRPRRFSDLLVQEHVAAALRGAVARGRVGHGYLLTGPRGVGKTTAARILAMALNCEASSGDGEPCGECAACNRISAGQVSHDVVEIDAASNRGVDDARDLRERAMYAASQEGNHKVYIVDEAHMLTREAWNALLKILEEPPPGVVFVFATTEPQKIANAAAPVMSRLQRFDFRRIGPVAIQDRLRQVLAEERLEGDEDALLLIARHADGGMRDALSVLDQCLSFGDGPLDAARVRDVLGLVNDEVYGGILDLIAERKPEGVFGAVAELVDAGADLVEVAASLAELLRAVLMHHYDAEAPALSSGAREVVARAASRLQAEDVVRMLKLLGEAETPLRRSANPRLIFETLLLRWTLMDRTAELKSLLQGRAPEPAAAPAPSTPRPPKTIPEPDPGQGDTSNPAFTVPWTEEGIRAVWPEIVATASRQSRFLGQALEDASPKPLSEGRLALAFEPDHAVSREGVERQKESVATIVSARLGTRVAVELAADVDSKPTTGSEQAPRPGRLTVGQLREDRLDQLRQRDPALNAIADALDLELIDDG